MQKRAIGNWKGIDISHWQGTIDWDRVQSTDLDFVYVKATEGQDYKDPLFIQNVKGATNAGLRVGCYHFARFKTQKEAALEAAHFARYLIECERQLPPVLDLETSQGLSRTAFSDCVLRFSEVIEKKAGRTLMLYTSTAFAEGHLSPELKIFPLWIAHYGVNPPHENGIWDRWTVFQYTDSGAIPGIRGHVDLNEWDQNQSEHWANPNSTPKGYGLTQIGSEPFPVHQSPHTLTIQKGDSFWKLESQHGWPHGTLQHYNPGLDPRSLQIDQKINCPTH